MRLGRLPGKILQKTMPPTHLEVVFRHKNGREEVRYRRPIDSASAKELREFVDALREDLGEDCQYGYRYV